MTAAYPLPADPEAAVRDILLRNRLRLARAHIAAEAAKSKRTNAELIRIAMGARPDLGPDFANAAGALVAERTGALVDWPAEDVERAADTLRALKLDTAPAA